MTWSTRDRLLDAGERLFAQRGFEGTSIGDVEEAAGFTRRGGTVYKHFASKEALFSAIIDRYVDATSRAADVSALLPLGDLRSELTLLARVVLIELANEEHIHRVLDLGGHHVAEARERMLTEVLEPSYRRTSELLERWIGPDATLEDPAATITMLLGGLVNLRRNAWTFGRAPLDITDDQAVVAWVDLALTFIEAKR